MQRYRTADNEIPNFRSVAPLLFICLLATFSNQIYATNHMVRINEVMAGLNGDSSIQFVEIVAGGSGEKAWGPNGGVVGRAMLVFSDAVGLPTGRFVFPADAPAGKNTVLIATQAFANLTGITPDFIMPELVTPIAGKVCYKNNPENTAVSVNLCLSYGSTNFTGNTEGAGTAHSAELPIMHSSTLSRISDFTNGANSNSSFALKTPTPASTNSPGSAADLEQNMVGEVVLPFSGTLVSQGKTLFVAESFHGNGRTCGNCHIPSDAFGLSPTAVALLDNSDPLFVNEVNVNTLVVNSAGSLNPSASPEATQPSDFVLGGILTGSLGGSATVLAGTGDTYLILGGDNLNVPNNIITDANGNSGTLMSFTSGNLNGPSPNGDIRGLEDSNLLKGPRALITENINGFAEHAFMRGSPTLLNIQHTAPYGLSGEFANLQAFSARAVKQHFTRDLDRVAGKDFRMPTSEELDAMATFMESIQLPDDGIFDETNEFDRFVSTAAQQRGRDLFFGEAAKCSVCHSGRVLASSDGRFGTSSGMNESFNSGVSNLTVNTDDVLPTEQEIGQAGNTRKFSTPPLMGVKNTGPFFHDNSVSSLLNAIKFYNSAEFRASPAFQQVQGISSISSPGNAEDIEAFLKSLVELPFTFTSILDFGIQLILEGASAPMIITIINTGQDALTLSNITLTGTNAGEFAGTTVLPDTNSFGAGQSRTIAVNFDPAVSGQRLASVELDVADGTETFSIGITLTGIGDSDDDNDGISDTLDNCPSTSNANQRDTDNDGSGDACDSDDDNDGVPDSTDKFPLNASDSVDTDNDGMGNNFENTYGLNPLAPGDASLDTDGDGLTNLEEFQVGRIPTVHEGALIEIINSIILEE